jgi:hypothetical protein
MRTCGECNLCCKLVPVAEIDKGAGKACKHQRFKKGCAIYHRGMPVSCQLWNCRWLVNDDTADQVRPDRAGYVIDLMPDFVTASDEGQSFQVEVVQIWVANYNRTIYRTDKNLQAYIKRRGAEGKLALLRFDSRDALTIIPPNMTSDHQWHEVQGKCEPQHTPEQLYNTPTVSVPTVEDAFEVLRGLKP